MNSRIMDKAKSEQHFTRFIRVSLYRYGDNKMLVVTPTGISYCIDAEPQVVESLLRLCDDTCSLDEVLTHALDPHGFADVFYTLAHDGCLRSDGSIEDEQDWVRFASLPLEMRPEKWCSVYIKACEATIGEGIERYCSDWIREELIIEGSYNELKERGEHAIDPNTVMLYSDKQYNTPGFPFVPFTRDLRIHWVRGRSLTRGIPAWIPASFVYVNWYTGPFEKEVPITNLFYPGLAVGSHLDFAIAAGIQEIIERYATMIWWLNRQPLPAMKLPPDLAFYWQGKPYELGQRAWVIYLEQEIREFDSLPQLKDFSQEISCSLLEQRGYEIFYTDITTPDVALTNIRVARVVIPGLMPNFPTGFPFLGKNRICEVHVALGWRLTSREEHELNCFPMLYA